MRVLRGTWRFFAGDAPEMLAVVALVVGLSFAVGHEPYAVAVLPAVVALGLTGSVVARARARRGRPPRGWYRRRTVSSPGPDR